MEEEGKKKGSLISYHIKTNLTTIYGNACIFLGHNENLLYRRSQKGRMNE